MILKEDFLPSFRDSDRNGLVSLKGYLNCFLDASTILMNSVHRSNDELFDEFGVNCIYTKYVVHIFKEADRRTNIQSETWLEEPKSQILTYFSTDFSRNGEVVASARAEACAFDRKRLKIDKLERIGIPDGFMEARKAMSGSVSKFRDLEQDEELYVYSHKVRYTDLDSNEHMTNLRYVDLVIDTFDSEFYMNNMITDFEIHFMNQCFEGEEIKIYKKQSPEENDVYFITVYKENGEVAVKTKIKVSNR